MVEPAIIKPSVNEKEDETCTGGIADEHPMACQERKLVLLAD